MTKFVNIANARKCRALFVVQIEPHTYIYTYVLKLLLKLGLLFEREMLKWNGAKSATAAATADADADDDGDGDAITASHSA